MIDQSQTAALLHLASRAADIARDLVLTRSPGQLSIKGDRDLASEVDLAVERSVRAFLQRESPEIGFLGEEEGASNGGTALQWILDPIDGTVNFLHGVPLCAVSIGLVAHGATLAALIDLPFLGTRYTALKHEGAHCGERRITVSSSTSLASALVSVDQYAFGHNHEHKNWQRHRLIAELVKRVQRVRIIGASAIDLAWTADGRLDACVMLGNKPWDTAAGVLLAREAGARVVDEDGSEHSYSSQITIATSPKLERELMEVVKAALHS